MATTLSYVTAALVTLSTTVAANASLVLSLMGTTGAPLTPATPVLASSTVYVGPAVTPVSPPPADSAEGGGALRAWGGGWWWW